VDEYFVSQLVQLGTPLERHQLVFESLHVRDRMDEVTFQDEGETLGCAEACFEHLVGRLIQGSESHEYEETEHCYESDGHVEEDSALDTQSIRTRRFQRTLRVNSGTEGGTRGRFTVFVRSAKVVGALGDSALVGFDHVKRLVQHLGVNDMHA